MTPPTLAELVHLAAAETRVAPRDVERVVGFLARFGLIEVDVADHGGFRRSAPACRRCARASRLKP